MLSSQLKRPAKIKEVILVAGLTLITISFGLNWFFTPKQQEIQTLQAELKQYEDQVESLKKLNQKIQELKKKESLNVQEEAKAAMSEDPRIQMIQRYKKQKYSHVSELFKDIADPFFRSSVKIESMQYQQTTRKEGYLSTKFNIVATGHYSQVLAFIKKLENVSALIALDGVLLNTKGGSEFVSLSLAGTFYQVEDENV